MSNNSRMNFIELITRYEIEIPMLQRDYAYGRANESEKRKNFLENFLRRKTKRSTMHFMVNVRLTLSYSVMTVTVKTQMTAMTMRKKKQRLQRKLKTLILE